VQIALAPAGRYLWEGAITDERVLNHSRWIFGIRSKIGEADLIEREIAQSSDQRWGDDRRRLSSRPAALQ
jgi:hypothetical protein